MTDLTICTLASHSALQIMKGARDEGIKNIAVAEKRNLKAYQSFGVCDEIITLDSFKELLSVEDELASKNAVLIPHGSLVNALSQDQIDSLKINYYGNRNILKYEADRLKQREWLKDAGLILPRIYTHANDIDGPVIIKFDGAGGGKGYFLAHTPEEFEAKIKAHPNKRYIIQEYIVGAPIYIHFFQSSLTGELEIMGFDKRYESNVDSV